MSTQSAAHPTLADGRFVVERRIGEGGQAAVYQVLDTRLSVRRAIKILLPEAAQKKKLRARFVGEAQAMAALDHPHIARVYDVYTDGELPYLVLELVTGGTLADWTTRHGRMPPRLAVTCVREVAQGVAAAHAAGVIHRDIKPQNVLVTADGVCKLTDFGIARIESSSRTRAGAAMGTQGYMAPEQARDASTVDVRVDVFSLGMLLFALVTNDDPVVRLAGRGLDQLPAVLRPIVDRATSFDRDRRQPSAQALLAELGAAWAALPPDPPAPPLASVEEQGEPVTIDAVPSGPGREDHTLAALSRLSATPAPARRNTPPNEVRPYTMSRAVPRGTPVETPEWVVERDRVPAVRERVEVTVPPQATPTSPSHDSDASPAGEHDRTKDGLGEEAVTEAKGFVDQVLTIVTKALLDPWRVVVPVLVILLLAGGIPILQTRDLRKAAEEARTARTALHDRFLAEKGIIDEVEILGADRATLDTMWAQWEVEEREPQRSQAIERFLTAVDNELRFRAAPGIGPYESAKDRVGRIRTARAAYATEMREFDALTTGGFTWGITP